MHVLVLENEKCTQNIWVLSHFGCVWLFATLWIVACQAPLFMGFSRQEYWSGLEFAPPWGSSWPRGQTCIYCVSCISYTGRQILYHWHHLGSPKPLSRFLKNPLLLYDRWPSIVLVGPDIQLLQLGSVGGFPFLPSSNELQWIAFTYNFLCLFQTISLHVDLLNKRLGTQEEPWRYIAKLPNWKALPVYIPSRSEGKHLSLPMLSFTEYH